MRHLASYPRSGAICKVGAESSFDGIPSESSCGQEPRRLRVGSPAAHEVARTLRLGSERGERVRPEVCADAPLLEVGRDRPVAVAAPCQCRGSGGREPAVVDDSRPLQGLQGVSADVRRHLPAAETLLQPLPGEIVRSERSSGHGERLGAAELTSEPPCRRPVEFAPQAHSRAEDRLGGQRAPSSAVEVDGEAPARLRAQRGDDRHA